MLQWILGGCTILSTLIAALALLRLGTQRGIDDETLAKMKRERQREEADREDKRRADEQKRETDRIRADEDRNDVLRRELAALVRRSNQRFRQWQEAVEDLDDLWAQVEDELLPWMRDAYSELKEAGIEIRRPPAIRRRHDRRRPVDEKLYDDEPIERGGDG